LLGAETGIALEVDVVDVVRTATDLDHVHVHVPALSAHVSFRVHERKHSCRDFMNDFGGRTIESRGPSRLPVQALELI